MIKIVKASKRHVKDFIRIGHQHWSYKWITSRYFNNVLKTSGFHFVAVDGKKVVGGIMVVEEDYPRFEFYFLAVDKKHLRRGIGTALIKKVETRMKKGTYLFVDTSKYENDAIKFYKKVGFREMGRVKNWFERGITGIILAKKI